MNIQIIGNGNITSNNFNACFLLEKSILVDAPAGILKQLKKINKNLDEISIIIITHLHGDHYFDLPFILLHEYARKRTNPLVIIGPKNLKKKVTKLLKLAFNESSKYLNSLDLTFVNAESIQNSNLVNDLTFSAINVKHGKLKNCFAFIVKNDKTSLGFTGDTELCPGLTYLLKKVKTCIIDVAPNKMSNHLQFDQLKKLVEEYKINYIPIHFPDEIRDDLAKMANVKIIGPEEQFFV